MPRPSGTDSAHADAGSPKGFISAKELASPPATSRLRWTGPCRVFVTSRPDSIPAPGGEFTFAHYDPASGTRAPSVEQAAEALAQPGGGGHCLENGAAAANALGLTSAECQVSVRVYISDFGPQAGK